MPPLRIWERPNLTYQICDNLTTRRVRAMAKPNPIVTPIIEHPASVNAFDAIKVFSATKFNDRDVLGELITRWMDANPGIVIVDKIVTQSSDQAYHCLAITLFYKRAHP